MKYFIISLLAMFSATTVSPVFAETSETMPPSEELLAANGDTSQYHHKKKHHKKKHHKKKHHKKDHHKK